MAQGPTGDFEGMAARVVARLTGERVVIQDDGSQPAMPDIRIDYVDQPPACVEAVVDIDPAYAAMDAEVWKPPRPIPADRVWHVRVSGRSNLKKLRRDLPAILGDLHDLRGPHVDRLARMGVSITGPSEPTPAQPGGIYLLPEGVSGSAIAAWPVFWIGSTTSWPQAAQPTSAPSSRRPEQPSGTRSWAPRSQLLVTPTSH
jgi:hypothetical protein